MSTVHAARPYQADLINRVDNAWVRGAQNVLGVLPCGAGKTFCFASIIADTKGAVCAIAHRGELVTQISLALAREGVRHRIIGSTAVARSASAGHMEKLGCDYVSPTSRVAVASVDTLIRLVGFAAWFDQVALWVLDECFPAGTLIDGRPIETIRVGDTVTAFNEQTGGFEQRKVVRLFKNPMPKHMVSICAGHHVVESTSGHPFWTRRGWVEAINLRLDDELLVHVVQQSGNRSEETSGLSIQAARSDFLHADMRLRASSSASAPETTRDPQIHVRDLRQAGTGAQRWGDELLQEDRAGLLQHRVRQTSHVQDVVGDDGAHESQVRFGTHDESQPDEACRHTSEGLGVTPGDRTCAEDSRWQRPGANRSGEDAVHPVRSAGVRVSTGDQDGGGTWGRRPADLLQARHGQLGAEDRPGSGRVEPPSDRPTGSRLEEGCVFEWHRVDRIEVQERDDPAQSDAGVADRYVYNFEVDGLHTYVANGIVVHNCHHLVVKNKWGKAVQMFPKSRGMGVSATPMRADGQGLGRRADGLMDEMVVGPNMRDLIGMRYLADYRIVAKPSDIDLTDVITTGSGDYSPPKLSAARAKSHITGDIVEHYLQYAAGQRGITFDVDVRSATETAAMFRAKGVPAEVVTGDTPDDVRRAITRRFENGEILQMVNVDLFGEGYDVPACSVVSMGRPTQSFPLFYQQFCRPGRIDPNDPDKRFLVLDHVGNVARHGLPDAPREWSLDRREKRARSGTSDAIPTRTCLNPDFPEGSGVPCASVYERFRKVCPFCQFPVTVTNRSGPEHVDGVLAELDPAVLAAMRGETAAVMQGARMPVGVTPEVRIAIMNRHHAMQTAQIELRRTMALWSGWQQHLGRTLDEQQARFYYRYGVDTESAQAYKKNDALTLRERILEELNRHNVIEAAPK